jgi:hypothetical protein
LVWLNKRNNQSINQSINQVSQSITSLSIQFAYRHVDVAQHGDKGSGGANNNGMVRVQDHVGHRPDGNAAFLGEKILRSNYWDLMRRFWGIYFHKK